MAAFGHLGIAAVSLYHGVDNVVAGGWWERPLAYYGSLNFAVWRYGFFSPDVGNSTEVAIDVHRENGSITHFSTLNGFKFFMSNGEAVNRLYGFKRHTSIDNDLRDLAARSVATRMFNLFPDATRIDYTVRDVGYPSMKDYVRGAPIHTGLFYTTTFDLDGPEETDQTEPSGSVPKGAAIPKSK